jgi:hypothetical protein
VDDGEAGEDVGEEERAEEGGADGAGDAFGACAEHRRNEHQSGAGREIHGRDVGPGALQLAGGASVMRPASQRLTTSAVSHETADAAGMTANHDVGHRLQLLIIERRARGVRAACWF